MQRFITRHLYLLAVGGGLAVYLVCQRLDGPTAPALTLWSALMLGLAALLERLQPFQPQWRQSAADEAADWQSAGVLVAGVEPLLQAILPLLVSVLPGSMASGAGWPLSAWPLGWQILGALLWMELAKYGSHRLHHQWAGLWRLHALHHSPARLYWLNQLRVHPLNHILNTLVSLLPLLWLGVPGEILLGALAITQPVLMLQHANVRSDNGWVNWVLSTNEAHRWHHSADPAEAHANYGSALLIWDHVFGTFRAASADSAPQLLGLFDADQSFPSRGSYLQQLTAPFLPPCCRAPAA